MTMIADRDVSYSYFVVINKNDPGTLKCIPGSKYYWRADVCLIPNKFSIHYPSDKKQPERAMYAEEKNETSFHTLNCQSIPTSSGNIFTGISKTKRYGYTCISTFNTKKTLE